MATGICNTGEEGIRQARQDRAEIKVYADGSGIDEAIGAAAVLERRGRDREQEVQSRSGVTT